MKKYILPVMNISISIISFFILLISTLSDNVIYLMIMTLFIGWVMPYLVLLITGIEMIKMNHPKMALVFNILCIMICILNLYFTIRLFDLKMIVLLLEYILISILSIINVVYFVIYIKNNPDYDKRAENEKIKRLKKENNGAVV